MNKFYLSITVYSFEACLDFIYKMNSLSDDNFFKVIDRQNIEIKKQIEKAILFAYISKYYKHNKVIKNFYENYTEYISNKLKDNPEEYCNNSFCQYLLFENVDESFEEWNKEKVFGKTVEDILNILNERSDEILERMDLDEDVTEEEKEFVNNVLLMYASNLNFEANVIYETFSYLDKPSLKDGKEIQLYKLFLTAEKLHELDLDENTFIAIKPPEFFSHLDYGNATILETKQLIINLARFTYEYLEEINDFDLFNLLYVVYHEIGHINQFKNIESFSKEMQELFKIEFEVFKENEDFYRNNYTFSFLEGDANEFAFKEIEKDFKDDETIMELCEKYKFGLPDDDSLEKYKERLCEEYNKLHSLDQKQKK